MTCLGKNVKLYNHFNSCSSDNLKAKPTVCKKNLTYFCKRKMYHIYPFFFTSEHANHSNISGSPVQCQAPAHSSFSSLPMPRYNFQLERWRKRRRSISPTVVETYVKEWSDFQIWQLLQWGRTPACCKERAFWGWGVHLAPYYMLNMGKIWS